MSKKRPKDDVDLIAQCLGDIASALSAPSVPTPSNDPTQTRRYIGKVYSNYDHEFYQAVADQLKDEATHAEHTAWNFWACIWWEDDQYHEYIMQYKEHVETLSDPDIHALISKVNDKYGRD